MKQPTIKTRKEPTLEAFVYYVKEVVPLSEWRNDLSYSKTPVCGKILGSWEVPFTKIGHIELWCYEGLFDRAIDEKGFSERLKPSILYSARITETPLEEFFPRELLYNNTGNEYLDQIKFRGKSSIFWELYHHIDERKKELWRLQQAENEERQREENEDYVRSVLNRLEKVVNPQKKTKQIGCQNKKRK